MNTSPSAGHGDETARTPLKLTVAALVTISATWLLLGSEIWLVAAALVWALDGIIGLNVVGLAAAGLLVGAPAVWASAAVLRLAVEAERDHGDSEPT